MSSQDNYQSRLAMLLASAQRLLTLSLRELFVVRVLVTFAPLLPVRTDVLPGVLPGLVGDLLLGLVLGVQLLDALHGLLLLGCSSISLFLSLL